MGGLGKDVLNGGLGADAFVFRSVAEAGLGTGRDVVQDFRRGVDKIDLVGIDANSARAGDQVFKFIGSSAFSGAGGELRYNVGVLTGDVDGDGRAEFTIEIGNLAALSQTDLLL